MRRISGLDPAGPEFTNTPTFVRLDPTDAVFVDTMHTNGDPLYKLGAGTAQPMGHLDFYPNGGLDQPGCGIVSSGFDFLACSHCRSYDLYRVGDYFVFYLRVFDPYFGMLTYVKN